MKRFFAFLIALAMAFCLFTACGTQKESYSSNTYDWQGVVAEEVEPSADNGGNVSGQVNHILVSGVDTDRKLIYQVNLGIRTEQYNEDYAWIMQKLTECGGYIYSEYTYGTQPETSKDSGRSTSMTLKVPIEKLEQFLNSVEEKSNVISKQMDVEDTTDYYYDTETRIELLETRYAKLEEYLRSASSMEDIITLESEMSNILYQLDELKGTKRGLDNQIAYSTVNIDLEEIVKASSVSYESDGLGERMKNGIVATFRGVVSFLENLLVFLVAALPVFALLGVLALIVLLIVKACIRAGKNRRQKRNASQDPAQPLPPQA